VKSALLAPPDFFNEYHWDGRPFLLVGMGPSFSRIHDFDTSGYNILGINKVVREIPVDLCHCIDFYIVDKVADAIEKQAKHLVVPYFPHFGYRPNFFLNATEVSQKLRQSIKDKMLCYNLSTIRFNIGKSPIIEANYFNAEASLNLIANLGCKVVKAIGIDGGTNRADAFKDHGPCDPRGFDLQWTNMARTIKLFNMDYHNLGGAPLNPNLEVLLEEKVKTI
jgi:hypothetical protein